MFIPASALLAMHSIYIGQLLRPAAAPLIVRMCVCLGGLRLSAPCSTTIYYYLDLSCRSPGMSLFAQNWFCLFSHWIESIVKTNGTYWKLNITLWCDFFPKQTPHITKTRLHFHEYICAMVVIPVVAKISKEKMHEKGRNF